MANYEQISRGKSCNTEETKESSVGFTDSPKSKAAKSSETSPLLPTTTPHTLEANYGCVPGIQVQRLQLQQPKGWGARHTLAVLGCLGFFVSFFLRVNMSMAIVAMVNHTALASSGGRPSSSSQGSRQQHADPLLVQMWAHQTRSLKRISFDTGVGSNLTSDNSTDVRPGVCEDPSYGVQDTSATAEDGPFAWDEMTQGVILSSYFVGYTVSQIPGGRLAERAGAARTFGLGILVTSLLNLLTPICTVWSVKALVAIRIIQGVTSGVTCPAIHFMLARWVPPLERSRISTFVYVGKQLGTAAAVLVAGPLASAGGWQTIFYVSGVLGMVWYCGWLVYVFDTPSRHPRISTEERVYIDTYYEKRNGPTDTDSVQHTTAADSGRRAFPWGRVLRSRAVWSLVVVHFCQNWGDYMIMTELPTYISSVFHYPLSMNSLMSSLPQLVKTVLAISASCASDWLAQRGLQPTASRKLWNSIGMYIPAVLMLGVAYAGCDDKLVISLVVATMAFNGAVLSGYNINHMDLAPNYAGTLMGLTNCVATLAGVIAPFATGYIISGEPTLGKWRLVFQLAAGMFVLGNSVFCACGTAQQQAWNRPQLAQYATNIQHAASSARHVSPQDDAQKKNTKRRSSPSVHDGALKTHSSLRC